MNQYLQNLSLWARGIRWLWTRAAPPSVGQAEGFLGIVYKPGFGPWRFLPLYLSTYLAGTLAGYGVCSLSRAWADRSEWTLQSGKPLHPFARFMTRLLDWAFPGSVHGRHTGPRLWGSVSLRD